MWKVNRDVTAKPTIHGSDNSVSVNELNSVHVWQNNG